MEVKKLSPFDFIKSINEGRRGTQLLKDCKADQSLEHSNPDSPDKAYVPFIVNRGLSYFKDTTLFANEMNLHANLPHRMQYDFYKHIVTPGRRFSKWGKKAKTSEDIKMIQKAYDYSKEKAEAVYPIMSKSQIKLLHSFFDEGGR